MDTFNLKRFIDKPTELFNVPVNIIQFKEGWNSREDYGNIDWLANSIIENGLRVPLVLFVEYTNEPTERSIELKEGSPKAGFPNGFYNLFVSDGHRRFTAIQKAIQKGAEIHTVRCRFTGKHDKEADRLLDQILMNSGKSLTPLEQQKIFKRLSDYGWTQPEIAKRTGISQPQVANMLLLSTVDNEVKASIEREEISVNAVLSTLGEVREMAAKEGKTEAEVYQMLLEHWKENGNGKKFSGTKAKEVIQKIKREKLTRNHTDYFDSLTDKKLIEEIFVSNMGMASNDYKAIIEIPIDLYNALKKRWRV